MVAKILSAGVVVFNRDRDYARYLLLRAFNYWDFPKGVLEPGETPHQCAIREVEEETGITDLQFHWGEVYRETAPYYHGRKVARYYIAETLTTHVHLAVNPLLGRPEHSAYRWTTRSEAWPLLTPRVRAILEWADNIIGIARKRPRPERQRLE